MFKKILFLSVLLIPQFSQAFCGFYVAKADASLYNQASQVVMVRKENKTVLSLMNDYQGDLNEFALVIPVPEILTKEQINIGDNQLFKQLDNFTAPRLVEYHDQDPCQRVKYKRRNKVAMMSLNDTNTLMEEKSSLSVTVEAEYTIGEYDIVILSAKESDGLERWLQQNGYKIPQGSATALRPYIKQGMKFFVAKVNLKQQSQTGLKFLRPLQFAFESEKFMLPIRLGMINAKGAQDLLVYLLTEKGRVEVSNYQTLKLPSNKDIPVYIKNDFARFYKSMFDHQVKKHKMQVVFTEYFWNMGWCDPCVTQPLSASELKKLGVFWLGSSVPNRRGIPVQVTRLHVRYTAKTFPEDLMFQETADTQNFQGRYVLHHPWTGNPQQCKAAEQYFDSLAKRYQQEARVLAELTGWDLKQIRGRMNLSDDKTQPATQDKWWKNIWE